MLRVVGGIHPDAGIAHLVCWDGGRVVGDPLTLPSDQFLAILESHELPFTEAAMVPPNLMGQRRKTYSDEIDWEAAIWYGRYAQVLRARGIPVRRVYWRNLREYFGPPDRQTEWCGDVGHYEGLKRRFSDVPVKRGTGPLGKIELHHRRAICTAIYGFEVERIAALPGGAL